MTRIIEIQGIIGAGKSSLLRAFPASDYTRVEEPVEENPWLAAFYAEYHYLRELRKCGNLSPARTTPMMEVYLQARRFNAICQAKKGGLPIVCDFGRPVVFARNLHAEGIISQLDFNTFLEVRNATEVIPDLVFYLDGLDRAWKAMERRGRSIEKGVPYSYQVGLDGQYRVEHDYLRGLGVPTVVFDWPDGGDLVAIEAALRQYDFPAELDFMAFEAALKKEEK
ncbi:MAG: deoxynucleoside kinase [Methanobacteriota archaeon]